MRRIKIYNMNVEFKKKVSIITFPIAMSFKSLINNYFLKEIHIKLKIKNKILGKYINEHSKRIR